MAQDMDKQRGRRSGRASPKAAPKPADPPPGGGADPFGTWLQRSLTAQYTKILEEPIPQDLLDLIEDDRTEKARPGAKAPGKK